MKFFGDHARCILYIELSYWWIGQLNYCKTMHMRKKFAFSHACCFINKLPNVGAMCHAIQDGTSAVGVTAPHNFAAAVTTSFAS